jgi:hypothetical protein
MAHTSSRLATTVDQVPGFEQNVGDKHRKGFARCQIDLPRIGLSIGNELRNGLDRKLD